MVYMCLTPYTLINITDSVIRLYVGFLTVADPAIARRGAPIFCKNLCTLQLARIYALEGSGGGGGVLPGKF